MATEDPEHRLVLAVVPGTRTLEKTGAIVAEVSQPDRPSILSRYSLSSITLLYSNVLSPILIFESRFAASRASPMEREGPQVTAGRFSTRPYANFDLNVGVH